MANPNEGSISEILQVTQSVSMNAKADGVVTDSNGNKITLSE